MTLTSAAIAERHACHCDPSHTRAPLAAGDFVRIAANGFGDAQNSYAHAMTWFRDRVYVGTSRHALALLALFPPPDPPAMSPWPVPVPPRVEDIDLRGEIRRLEPVTGIWELVHRSPEIDSRAGGVVPRELGYRGMAVFQGRSDPEPALYVTSVSSVARAGGARLLRSLDGQAFDAVGSPGLGNDRIASFRSLVEFDGWLYAAPTGEGTRWNSVSRPIVLRSADPASGVWEVATPPAFGDPTNSGIFELAVFDGHLYAGTLNHIDGFQIWKTPATGEDACRWTRVLDAGAGRGSLNEIALSMCAFRGALYVGSGIQNGGYDRTNNVGPAAAELIRIYPDDSWDLIAGTPRIGPDGAKLPLAGCGPGFDNIFAGYVWRLAVHDDVLYATTFDWSVFLPYAHQAPRGVRRMMRRLGVDRMVAERGGFDLMRSTDGATWTGVVHDGFGNPYNHGGRNLLSTPHGLMVGTANPFGPEVAARMAHGWTYTANPAGGAEVWLGRSRSMAEEAQAGAVLAMLESDRSEPTDAAPPAQPGRTVPRRAACLVTGATGFVGSEVVPALLERGMRVRVLALAETVGDLVHAEDVEIVVGSLDDDQAVRDALASVSTVYHLAGVLPGASRAQLADVNIRGTELLLRACRGMTALERFVFTSSVAVYEGAFLPDDWPISELSRLEPGGSAQLQAYGQSKVAAERLVRHHAREGGFGFVILRPATSYGLGNRGFVKTVADIIDRPGAGSRAPGRFPSQLLHGRDLAEGIVLAGTHALALGETFNLAGSEAVDSAGLAILLRQLAGLHDDSPELSESARQWERYLRPYDTRKAQRELGFHPRVPLREGLAEVVASIVEASPEPGKERTACVSS